MNIAVLLKQVHDPNLPRSLLKIADDGLTLALPPSAVPIMNGYDANALEQAIKIKEKVGGSIMAFSLGPYSAKEILRRAIAMGADKTLHIDGAIGPGNDAWAIASSLAAAIRLSGNYDLILTGRSASDTDAGLVPAFVAGLLQLPFVTPVRALSPAESGSFVADRITDAGIRRLSIRGPAVIAVSSEINKPRSPQLKGVALAKRAAIPTMGLDQLGISSPAEAVRLVSLRTPPAPSIVTELLAGSPIDAGRALADRLRHEGLI